MKKFTKTMMIALGAYSLGAISMSAYDKKCNLKNKFKTYLDN